MDKLSLIYVAMQAHLSLWVFVIASVLGSVLGLLCLFILLEYLQKKRDSFLLLMILKNLKRPLYFLIPTLFIEAFTPILGLEGDLVFIPNLIQAVLILLITWLLLRLVKISELLCMQHCNKTVGSGRARTLKTQIRFISRFFVFMVLVIMTAVFLMTFESVKRLGLGLLTSAGIASVILGFAAQKTLGSVLAGFQIAFNNTLRIDDAVCVEGEWGQVEEITLTHVIIRLLSNRRLIMPINYFMEKPFQNWTLVSSELIQYVILRLDYAVDIKLIRQELDRILENNKLWDRKIKSVLVSDITDKCLEIKISISARNLQDISDLCAQVREGLIAYLHTHFPQALPFTRTDGSAFAKMTTDS
ncbi:MAG: hypothetical protein A3I12_04775 [Gammaproteobacteria bacterium RIFCSPLOWO2_02_FULL_38_11]|nr:MAG: hypothetical protein A3I12_04775 [Gammaproteobacteria bacterium RIFCSPLOWO2_02_FULL_38_11]